MLPKLLPENPRFSSGPCAKRPGWSPDVLSNALVGRSHRSHDGMDRINEIFAMTRECLKIPEDYKLGMMSGSATAAMESLLWNLAGARAVDVLVWDVFGKRWQWDLEHNLKLKDLTTISSEAGSIPDFSLVDQSHDMVFTWNGTSTGVALSDADWVSTNRHGLTICDAISAVFAVDLPWEKLDASAFSWQKALGSEAGLGMVVLSPRALERLQTYQPAWPIPGFMLLHEHIFTGNTRNTPSMLLIEDYLDAMKWWRSIDYKKRINDNYSVLAEWVVNTDWVDFLAQEEKYRSKCSVTLKIENYDWDKMHKLYDLMLDKKAGFDILGHIGTVPNLRIWCGPTVEKQDIQSVVKWIEWAYYTNSQK